MFSGEEAGRLWKIKKFPAKIAGWPGRAQKISTKAATRDSYGRETWGVWAKCTGSWPLHDHKMRLVGHH